MPDVVTAKPEDTIFNGKNILWVEDDSFLSGIIGSRLVELGVHFQLAISGESALQLLQKESFDLVMLDIMFPGMDGFAVLERMKSDEKTKSIPVIILSNIGEAEQVEKAKRLGAALFIVKAQHSLEEILQKIAETLKT